MPAAAAQAVPLVQETLRPPVPSTLEPLSVLTLPKARGVVETVQLAVTVAETLRVPFVVCAKAPLEPAMADASSEAPTTAVLRAMRFIWDPFRWKIKMMPQLSG
jgi:hypothetical protein